MLVFLFLFGDTVVLETFKMVYGRNFVLSVIGPWVLYDRMEPMYGLGESCLVLSSDTNISLEKFLNPSGA
jgi:hypothetical protein